jgi:hypothetical protein
VFWIPGRTNCDPVITVCLNVLVFISWPINKVASNLLAKLLVE